MKFMATVAKALGYKSLDVFFIHLFLFSILLVILVIILMVTLRKKRLIGIKTMRWVIVGTAALTAYPGHFLVGMTFLIIWTTTLCIGLHWYFWAYEILEKREEAKRKDNE